MKQSYVIRTESQKQALANKFMGMGLHKALVVTIEEEKESRRAAQNSLYWVWLQFIAKETGNDRDELHEYFKRKWLASEFVTVLGAEVEKVQSTTNLSVGDFAEYLTKLEAFCTEMGWPLPSDPNYEKALYGKGGRA